MVDLYGIRNCDTVKKARAWLEENGVAYRFNDSKVSAIEEARLRRWVSKLGWEKVLNRAGTTFRKLPEEDKANLDADKAIWLMLAQPLMIKRPVIEIGETLLAGFDPERYRSVLL